MCCFLTSEKVAKNDIENADDTHIDINVDNDRTIVFCGSDDDKYADVVSGG